MLQEQLGIGPDWGRTLDSAIFISIVETRREEERKNKKNAYDGFLSCLSATAQDHKWWSQGDHNLTNRGYCSTYLLVQPELLNLGAKAMQKAD